MKTVGSPQLRRLRILDRVFSARDICVAVMREIFDENAYERFLVRSGQCRSVDSYREFIREGEAAMSRKPRCC